MKTYLKAIVLVALGILNLAANGAEPQKSSSDKCFKVVFEVSVDGEDKWQDALRSVGNARKELGEATEMEVVVHGKGIGLLLVKTSNENADLKGTIEKLAASGVVFAACENTMRRMKVEAKDLLGLSTTVPSGVSEVIRKQAAGYAYIKSGV